MDTLQDVSTFLTISRLIFLKLRNVLDRHCRENENTHFMFNNFFSENCTVYDNVKRRSADQGTTNDVTTWRIRVASWITKAIRTYAQACTDKPIYNTYCFFTATMVS